MFRNKNYGAYLMPVNAGYPRLLSYYLYYGDNFKIECLTSQAVIMNSFGEQYILTV
jgi:hypothetical protein